MNNQFCVCVYCHRLGSLGSQPETGRMLIQECTGVNTCRREWTETVGRGESWAKVQAKQQPQPTLQSWDPFRTVLSCTNMPCLYLPTAISHHAWTNPQRGMTLDKGTAAKDLWESWELKAICWQHAQLLWQQVRQWRLVVHRHEIETYTCLYVKWLQTWWWVKQCKIRRAVQWHLCMYIPKPNWIWSNKNVYIAKDHLKGYKHFEKQFCIA